MLRTCLLLALAAIAIAQDGDDKDWCNKIDCMTNGQIDEDKPICGVTGADGAKETYKNMCDYQNKQCLKGILEVRAMIGACPVTCKDDGDCSDGNVCKKVDPMGVPCNGNENDCMSSCEKPQAKIDLCEQMVKDNSCPKATMKCQQKEDCDGKGCKYSASCVPLEAPEDCKIQGVQQCINSQFKQQAMAMKGKFDTCTMLNIYTTCGKNNGCKQSYLNWCLHGLPNQKGMGQADRPYPENCDLPACEGTDCDVKAYRQCINDISGGDLKAAYEDCDKLQKILNDCAVPNKCNVLYNCFQFKRHQPNCDLSSICGKMRPALEDALESPLLVTTTQKPKSSNTKAYAIIGSCFGGSALVALAVAVVMKRRRSADEATYTRTSEF